MTALPKVASPVSSEMNRQLWESWREGLKVKFTLPVQLPPLRMLLVWDNLAGHQTPEMVLWLCAQGILPLYTPLSGSWLNMAESMQRILKRRALNGQHPETPEQIIEWLETTANVWNQQPTPFEWVGKIRYREKKSGREQVPSSSNDRKQALGSSGSGGGE